MLRCVLVGEFVGPIAPALGAPGFVGVMRDRQCDGPAYAAVHLA